MKKQFGSRLKTLRQLANLTQSELAELVGISDRYLGRMERGLVSPSFDCIEKIARALRADPASLFLFPEEIWHGQASEVRNATQEIFSSDNHNRITSLLERENEAWEKAAILQCITGMTVKFVDTSCRVVWISTSAPDAPTASGKEINGQRCHEAFHGRQEPCPGCLLPATLATGQPSEGEMTSPSGRTFLTRCNPVLCADGSLRGAIHMSLDITARKNMEQALVHAQERLELLLAASPVVLYSCEPHGDHAATYISENMRTVFGHPPEAFLGNSSYWASHLFPGETDLLLARLPQLLDKGRLVQEYRFRHGDGSWRYVRDDLRIVRDRDGELLEIVGCMMDMTPTKAQEPDVPDSLPGHQRLLAPTSAIQLLIDAETGAILDASPAAREFYGHSDMGRMILQDLDGRDNRELDALSAAIRGAANPLFRFTHRLAGGKSREVDVLVTMTEYAGREAFHFLVMEVGEK